MSTINFACKKISIEQIIRCGFGLNKTGYKIVKFLLSRNEEVDIDEISKAIKKDRTTTQRAIKKIHDEGIILRRQENLSSGSFRFYYSIKDKEDIKKKIYNNLCDWNSLVEKEIKEW